ncbi:MAG: phospholipase D family protein [Alphaproteobacteria bacterium]
MFKRILSNGPQKDFVIAALQRMSARSRALFLAAPYFNFSDTIVESATLGKRVQLIIGLNSSTSPDAVSRVVGLPGVSVRYFTDRFHAKIYIFDDAALVGSAISRAQGFKQIAKLS